VTTVSVIMPAFNVEPFVGAALGSALSQTFDDFEVIVVDDGSDDGTAAAVTSVAGSDRRVRLVRQANRGLAGARNTAMRAARGEYFALLDSDDLWEPDFLAAQMDVLRSDPGVAIVTGNAWYLGGVSDGQPARPCPDSRPEPNLASIIADEWSIFIMSVMRRDVYAAIGAFDESMRSNEDYDFWLRAALAGFRFVRNDRPLGRYRVRPESLSADHARMLRGILTVYRKLRAALAGRPYELAVLEAQTTRFEAELLAAEAGMALDASDFEAARAHLSALHARRGGAALAIARVLARWSPRVLKQMRKLKGVSRKPVS
jgi:glycosyltransferase involved in cell wall biosynthesis